MQRAAAEEIMGSAVHNEVDPKDAKNNADNAGNEDQQQNTDRRRKFEEQAENAGHHEGAPGHTADSVAATAMFLGGKVTEQPWDGNLEEEKGNFVQEQLYPHVKLLIVDDRVVICGSSNLNDRGRAARSPPIWRASACAWRSDFFSRFREAFG